MTLDLEKVRASVEYHESVILSWSVCVHGANTTALKKRRCNFGRHIGKMHALHKRHEYGSKLLASPNLGPLATRILSHSHIITAICCGSFRRTWEAKDLPQPRKHIEMRPGKKGLSELKESWLGYWPSTHGFVAEFKVN